MSDSLSKNRIKYDQSKHVELLKRNLEFDKQNLSMWDKDPQALKQLKKYELEVTFWYYNFEPDIRKYKDLLEKYTTNKISVETFITQYFTYHDPEQEALSNLLSNPETISKLNIKFEALQNIEDKIDALELIDRIDLIIDLLKKDKDNDLDPYLDISEMDFKTAMVDIYNGIKFPKTN